VSSLVLVFLLNCMTSNPAPPPLLMVNQSYVLSLTCHWHFA
jgi:hypothetical protein